VLCIEPFIPAPIMPSLYSVWRLVTVYTYVPLCGLFCMQGSGGDGKSAEDDKSTMEDGTFDALERDFQETLDELMGDQSLEKFRSEYEKLHRALKKSHDNERRLMQKCRELNVEIVANAAKVSSALKLSQEDKATITSLKQVSHAY